jgi:hypothetical protein
MAMPSKSSWKEMAKTTRNPRIEAYNLSISTTALKKCINKLEHHAHLEVVLALA